MTLVAISSLVQTRVLVLLFLIYGFLSNNELQVSAKRIQDLAIRKPWPNATIPYVIDCSIANVVGAKQIIKDAMAAWENRTCIRFVKRTNQEAYLLIRRFKGCWGNVGYRRWKVATLSMGDGCEYNYVMMHELGHVIGFYHEHQRNDRDDFVDILWDNVMNSMWKQFYKRGAKTDVLDTELPYDTSSIMHYQFRAFTKNYSSYTIAMKNKNTTETPRPYNMITDLDVRKTREMYNCKHESAKSTSESTNEAKVPDNKTEVNNKTTDEIKKKTDVEIVEAVEVSLMSPGWLATKSHERHSSIMVNGKEMAKSIPGLNIVVFNYLSGRRDRYVRYSIMTKRAAEVLSTFIKTTPRRNYFLIVSKTPSLYHLRDAKLALKEIGITLPNYIASGSSICIVGYKGRENVSTKYVIGSPNEKASFLSMNITLPSDYHCQNDFPNCVSKARDGFCEKQAMFYLKACQRSCGSCKRGKPCKDENKHCEEWAKRRYCNSHPAYMLKYCKVSCKICRKELPPRIKGKKRSGRKRQIVLVDDSKTRVRKFVSKNEDDNKKVEVLTGVRCHDKSKSCRGWAKAGRCKTDSWVMRNCLISCKSWGSCDRRQIKPKGMCSEPFGLGWNRKLRDSYFTASSYYITGQWNASADNARLYMEDNYKNWRIGAWCSKHPAKQGEWLKIHLGWRKRITAVATQGRFRYYEHVKSFKLSYSTDDRRWKYYKENGRVKEFKGNCDHVTPVLNIFEKSIIARYIRFHPTKWYEGICMRVEVYGCRV